MHSPWKELVRETAYDYELYALDAVAGKQQWVAATGEGIDSSPTVANGMVYVGSYDGKLYAFSLS